MILFVYVMEGNQTTGLHFVGTYLKTVVSGNVQNSKKARQRVNKLKLHVKKVNRYSKRESDGVKL